MNSDEIQKHPNPMNFACYIFAIVCAHACLPTHSFAERPKLLSIPEATFYTSRIAADVRGVFHVNTANLRMVWTSNRLKFTDPTSQVPPKWVTTCASLAADGEAVSNESGNQSADSNGGSEPNNELGKAHKMLLAIAALITGFGVAILAIQWATWDVTRRIFHKLEDRAP